jgi:enoyl-CoA hydratase/carnithine racemase
VIRLAVEGGLWIVTLDRAERANSLTAAMLTDLLAVLDRAGPEGAVALVLTGTGRVFSAGADLDEARAGLATSPLWQEVSARVAALPCLTIAALNGTCAGGAMGMVLACDLRIAVAGAALFYPVMRLGFLPQPSDVPRLVRLVGPARTSMILLAGAKVFATEAQVWGLVDRLAEDPLADARLLATDALAAKPGHGAAIKAMIGRA